jgi:hypothetical protein
MEARGCSNEISLGGKDDMDALGDDLNKIEVGEMQQFRTLAVYPLFRPTNAFENPGYVLLDDGIAAGTARVMEVDGGGSVPELRFENLADSPVLLVDGQELVGAKQNRVVNLTILAPGKSTIVIPVSCVEAGRWSPMSAEFKSSDQFMYSSARANRASQVTQAMRAEGTRRSDQVAVWDDIASTAARLSVHSPTAAMSAIFERNAFDIEEFVRAFRVLPGQAGIVCCTSNGIGFDLFDAPVTLLKLFPKLLRSYALDALGVTSSAPATKAEVVHYLQMAAGSELFVDAAVGLGKDVRFSCTSLTGAALWAVGRYVHVCGFRRAGLSTPTFRSRMAGPRQRYS